MSTDTGVAIITGSAQGIGRAIALRLARDGFDIGLNDIPPKRDQLRSVAEEIEEIGQRAVVVTADVTAEEEVKEMVQQVVKELGSLDVMVANAGIADMTPLVSTSVETWDRIMTINTRGPFLCYKYAAEQMIKQGRGGRILGASSGAGRLGLPLQGPYSASKFAIRGLTQAAALELGKYGITVNSYAPGLIKSPMSDEFLGTETDDEHINWIKNHISRRPIKLDGQPEDIAGIVSYLVSKDARLVTGQCISVDGGINFS